jgi:catechol 2,3-dioxygenase-like lactoylglutathione lyase family enzyme
MEKTSAARGVSFGDMLNRIGHIGIWVTNQDEALAFYRDKLGFEVRSDVTVEEFNNMRWLALGVPGQDTSLVLQSYDFQAFEAAREHIEELLAIGINPPLIFEVDDCRAEIERLRAEGVEISQEPEEYFYGVDAGIRDPSGNSIRITQMAPVPANA